MGVFLTTREVAKSLQLNERTVTSLAKSGMLPAYKVAGQYRFTPAGLDNYLERCRVADINPANPTGEDHG